jgi:hypothetical protein
VLPGAGPPAPYHANVLEGGPGAGSPPSSAPIGHIDLVSLATHLSDAVGNLEIAKIHFENRSKQSKVGTTTTEAAALAEIQLKAAERKVLLLRRMAEAALRAAEAETHRLSQERQNLPSRILNDPGRAAAIRAVEAQLAAQEANLQILKLILAESRQEQ